MTVIRNGYYTEQSCDGVQKRVYKAIDNQPLPKKFQNCEFDEQYRNHYYFLIADLFQPDIRKMFTMAYLDPNSKNLISSSKSEIEIYKAAELVSNYQEINSL